MDLFIAKRKLCQSSMIRDTSGSFVECRNILPPRPQPAAERPVHSHLHRVRLRATYDIRLIDLFHHRHSSILVISAQC